MVQTQTWAVFGLRSNINTNYVIDEERERVEMINGTSLNVFI